MERDASTGTSETTIPEHQHFCPECNDVWLHQVEECGYFVRGDVSNLYRTSALCPIHEGESR